MIPFTRLSRCGVMLAGAAAFLLAAACSRTPSSRFYLLSPPSPAFHAEALASGPVGEIIGIGPVTIPAYLDRPQFVTRQGEHRLAIAEYDRWAEPLKDAAPRFLADRLAQRYPGRRLVVFPWKIADAPAISATVDIRRWDGPAGGPLTLDARWIVTDRSAAPVTHEHRKALSIPVESASFDSLATAYSRSLSELADAIGDSIAVRATVNETR